MCCCTNLDHLDCLKLGCYVSSRVSGIWKNTYSSHPDGHLQLAQHSPVGLLTWCPIMPLKHHQTWASWNDQHHETININLSMYPLVCDTSLSTKNPATQHETSAWLLPGFFLALALEPHDAASKQQVNCWVPVGLLMGGCWVQVGHSKNSNRWCQRYLTAPQHTTGSWGVWNHQRSNERPTCGVWSWTAFVCLRKIFLIYTDMM